MKTVKIVCLAGFVYFVALVIALERKDRVAVLVGTVSFGTLAVVFLKERFVYWNEVSRWHRKRKTPQTEK
jgi:hypothetical protein